MVRWLSLLAAGTARLVDAGRHRRFQGAHRCAGERLLTDPHAPSEQRAWVVRNLDPWYSAYNVQPGQKLYLTPEQRVRMC